MTWISRTVAISGLVLLVHACYSAQEHSALQSLRTTSPTPTAPSPSTVSLPLDISIEAVIATVITCLGLVLGSPSLRPIQWRAWAGKIEREGEAGFVDGSGDIDKDFGGNPFRLLETRPGFTDIRKQRKDFATWAKGSEPS